MIQDLTFTVVLSKIELVLLLTIDCGWVNSRSQNKNDLGKFALVDAMSSYAWILAFSSIGKWD